MLVDKKRDTCIGKVSKDDLPIDEVEKVLSFLEDVLIKLTISRIHEDSITQRLVQLALSNQCPLLKWIFIKDNEDNESGMREDIAISPQADPHNIFFLIEAKRLDVSLKKDREKEYVIGRKSGKKYIDAGGIERFKKEKHAKNFNNAALIGYILTDDFLIWENKINTWIEDEIRKASSLELYWEVGDKLINIKSSDKISKYKSYHSCLSGKQIILTHLWVMIK